MINNENKLENIIITTNILGEGSFGVVYQVKRLIDNNIYALKKVRLANMP
jgi:serine/threonine protein kinase